MHFQNCLLKEYIFKIAPTQISFLKFPLKKTKQKKNKNEIALTKKTFPKLFPQKIFFKNYFLNEGIFKKH